MTLHAFMRSAALVAALLAPCAGTGAVSPTPDEYQVKAVYLFNFGHFVEWPRGSGNAQQPFAICVVGDDPFGQTLDDVVRGESVGSRALVVRRFRGTAELGSCDIVFVSRGEEELLQDTVAAVRGRGVLTVTDAEGAERQGAIIVLFKENNRIRMRINLAAARENGLVISSKLLRPAEVVNAEGG